jgi:hypothetical protein
MLKGALFVCETCGGDHSFVWDDAADAPADFKRQLERHGSGQMRCTHTLKHGHAAEANVSQHLKAKLCGGRLREVQHPIMKASMAPVLAQRKADGEAAHAAWEAEQAKRPKLSVAEREPDFKGPRPGVNDGQEVTGTVTRAAS